MAQLKQKKQRVSITKPNVKPKINIETEEEVIAYIGEMEKEMNDLKEKMLNAIKESKIVDIKKGTVLEWTHLK